MKAGKPIRVVVADDHTVVRWGMRQFLADDPRIEVVGEASDGAQAVKLIDHFQPDVAVLDIQMPAYNGIEVARHIQSRRLPVGVLILTAYDDPPFLKAALEAGVTGYVLKNARVEEIIIAVYDVYRGKLVLDASLAAWSKEGTINVPKSEVVLTKRERNIIALVARGLTNRIIGVSLDISERTVQQNLSELYYKLQVSNRTEAVARAAQLGILSIHD